MTTTATSMYYDYDRILSYNAFISMIVGGRGLGKTYGSKQITINDYLKRGHHFIYLRRYKTELQNIKTYFTDIAAEYPDHELRVNGHEAQIRSAHYDDDDPPPWQTFGWFIALSNAASKKSVAYPRVRTIIYDECLLPRGHVRYLPNEYHALLEFINTVDRYQDRVRVFMLSNGVDIANPYFLQWEITPHQGSMRRYERGLVVVDFPDPGEYEAYAKRSRLGQLVAGSDYERYAIGNEFVASSTALVCRKPSRAEFMFYVEHEGRYTSLWYDHMSMAWHASSRIPKKGDGYTLTVRDSNETLPVLEPSSHYVQLIKSAYRHRRMTFDSQQVHAAYQSILAFLNTR